MAEQLCSSNNLLLVMDSLWFQHIILFSHPNFSYINIKTSSISTTTATPSNTSVITSASLQSQSLPSSPSSSTHHSEEDQEEEEEEEDTSSSDTSPVMPSKDECNDDHDADDEMKMKYKRKRPTRLNLVIASKTRCQSSSLPIHKLRKHLRRSKQLILQEGGLRKTRSCKSLMDLEYEEVKGFMDLGFTFDKEQLTPRMMSVIPGLQRVLLNKDHDHQYTKLDGSSLEDDHDVDDNQKKRSDHSVITRPYLSEAWLIKRPDSPLLNLRMPRFSSSSSSPAEMKKHLRFWARTVASAIQLEY